ncbi:DUF3530 family protein [Paraglaciecola sp. L3A3]|uniref:DUF3530 family protein n=1 Tax=Paraglaciecola sp. L3A3 TaxID=2686358 RepID=UPI00131B35E7|nr:DUF3530 family protein [Paraglaciecola sp. L3A3]
MLRQLDIQRGLFPDEYQSVELDGQQYVYVLRENTTPITRGVAVLIADSGVSMLSQQGLAMLATNLNGLGWTTLLLSAPDTAFYPLLEQEAVAEENNSAASTEEVTPQATTEQLPQSTHNKTAEKSFDPIAFNNHQADLIKLLDVAEKKVEEYPGFYLVVGQGTTAAWLTKIFAEAKSNIPDAFVAISPFWPDRDYNRQLPLLMARNPMPVLDIYSLNDNYWALSTTKIRQSSALKGLKLHYRQRQLVGNPQAQQKSNYLAKEMYGWLSNMGW